MVSIITATLGAIVGAIVREVLARLPVKRQRALGLRLRCTWSDPTPTKGQSPAHAYGCPCGIWGTPDQMALAKLGRQADA